MQIPPLPAAASSSIFPVSQGSKGHGLRVQGHLTVVVSTYEWPAALDVVLRALSEQSDSNFEVVVADDGSGPQTALVVQRWQGRFGRRLTHIWHPDEGFRAARARNLGALARDSDLLVFLDGDCVPRRDFVRATHSAARPGWFAVGRRLHLSPAFTRRVLEHDVPIHRWSLARWLSERGHCTGMAVLTPRDRRKVGRLGVPEFIPDKNAYSPVFLAATDFGRVNGYDLRYEGWGEEDVDLAIRLRRLGLRCGHLGASGSVLHLWHPSLVAEERPNWCLLEETARSTALEAVSGLRELERELEFERSGDEVHVAVG